MGVFRQLEERLGRWTDRLTARWLGGRPTAARLAAGLLEQLRTTPGDDGRPRLLNDFQVRLHPDDLAGLGDLEDVRRQVLERLRQEAVVRRLDWHGRPRLRLDGAPDLAAGDLDVHVVSSPGAGPAELRVEAQVHPLSDQPVLLGRDHDCAVRLDADGVSRRHARLDAVGDGWRVTDLGSTNGTFVNGLRISSRTLADGDELRCGPVRLVYREL